MQLYKPKQCKKSSKNLELVLLSNLQSRNEIKSMMNKVIGEINSFSINKNSPQLLISRNIIKQAQWKHLEYRKLKSQHH